MYKNNYLGVSSSSALADFGTPEISCQDHHFEQFFLIQITAA